MITKMRKFGTEDFSEVHHHEDDACLFCEAARQLFIEWPTEGYAVAFVENEAGVVRRIEGSQVDGVNVFCCAVTTPEEARAETRETVA